MRKNNQYRIIISRELFSNNSLTAKEKAVVFFVVNEQITDVRVIESQKIEADSLKHLQYHQLYN